MDQLVGWSRGDTGGPVWERFLQEGYVVAVADYRGGNMNLTSAPSGAGMITSIDDGLAVIEYVKSLPYVDPNRLNLYGVSLGGNLVMNLVSRVPVNAAIVGAPAAMWFLGMTLPPGGSGPDRFKNLKPDPETSRKNIEPIRTPVLILVGTADSLLPVTTMLHDALAAAGKSVRMEVYENRLPRLLPGTAGPYPPGSAAGRGPVRFGARCAGAVGAVRQRQAGIEVEAPQTTAGLRTYSLPSIGVAMYHSWPNTSITEPVRWP